MAHKLKSQYGYSYDNVKVLLGCWNTWMQQNAKDPNAYPIERAAGTGAGSSTGGGQLITATVLLQPEPAATTAP